MCFLRASDRPALDDVEDSLDLARRTNHDLAGLPAPRDEVESRCDRFGHAMLGGPFSPGAIERDSVWGAVARSVALLRTGVQRCVCLVACSVCSASQCERSGHGSAELLWTIKGGRIVKRNSFITVALWCAPRRVHSGVARVLNSL
jgi:hypothetical protein